MADKPRILIADDDRDFAAALAMRCRSLGLEAATAHDGLEALIAIVRDAPDLAVLDIAMPAADGLSVCERLARDPKLMPMPVVILSGRSDPETIARCEALGAHYLLKDAEAWPRLKRILEALLQGHAAGAEKENAGAGAQQAPPRPPRVLVVDDDPRYQRLLGAALQSAGIEVQAAGTAMQGYWLALREKPDLIITDYSMPEGSGDYLLVRLKSTAETRDIPVIVLTGWTVDGRRDYALERTLVGQRGAAAFLQKPVTLDSLFQELGRHIPLA